MIVVRLWGGLGNQMFQYACGYAVAKRNNDKLYLDTRFYSESYLKKNPHFSKQKLNLMEFPITYRHSVNNNGEYKLINCLQNRTISRLIRIPSKFMVKADDKLLYLKETRLSYLPYLTNKEWKNIYLDGYWQTEKYFQRNREDLKQEFYFWNDSISTYVNKLGILNENSVAIHMRMGDYSSKKKKTVRYNYIINDNYYIDAIDEIRRRKKHLKFYVFSNNIELARRLLGESTEFVYINEDRELSDIEEFEVMKSCSNHIISNSTFSWWAAWLADNTEGIKIVPDIFFGNRDIIPDEWIKFRVDN